MLDRIKNRLDKKAQGLSRNAIILLVIGVVVLVILIIGFTQGWGNIAPFLSGNNVDSISQSCSISCGNQGEQGYCMQGREISTEDESLQGVTCNYLDERGSEHGIVADFGCQAISCDQVTIVDLQQGETLEEYCNPQNDGQILQAMVDGELQTLNCQANQ